MSKISHLFRISAISSLLGAPATAQDAPPIQVGQPAPEFPNGTVDQAGQAITLAEYRGRSIVVLYFYPRDDTPGCTLEAKTFSADKSQYDAVNAVVLGVSTDDAQSHQEFIQKHGLKVRLVADPEKKIVSRWDVKNIIGWAQRVTFLIDTEGVVRKIFPDVTPKDHSAKVLQAIRDLANPTAPSETQVP